ncbi:hypothetical protein [Streptomyces sp. NPDC047999]|uniref:hypothetical protein n=1 Tax=Streptomyces sp. NPDC047999 TaxID=3365497 RepID=UPI003719B34C
MLSYRDVVSADLGSLTSTADDWDDMADGFRRLEEAYSGTVLGVATGGEWVGISAAAAAVKFSATKAEFAAGQTEARAIADILRDAHGQFTLLVGAVRDVVEQAKKDGMEVDSNGTVHFDFTELNKYRNDPDSKDLAAEKRAAVGVWNEKVKQAVKAVDDADKGVKLALHDAAGVKSFFERMFDSVLGRDGFNANAVGDIELVEARRAKAYADQILAGGEPSDLAEWERLMRDNSQDRVFSQTLLNSLGPEDTLKLSNRLNDLAYLDDAKDKRSYLHINTGLANSLATATRVPEFLGPRGADGKRQPLKYGSEEYQERFGEWRASSDGRFYREWIDELDRLGDDEFDSEVVGEKISLGHGHGQEVRGYQSLVTLMQQGEGYSPSFVSEVTDNMIAMEKKDPDIWDLRGDFSGDKDGWFANDPVDGALGVMSRDPEGAAVYLDPATDEGKKRFEYLLGQGDGARDWDVVDTREYRKVETSGPDVEDADTRAGLGAALTAAATGVDPSGGEPRPTSHSEANDRVFKHSLEFLSKQGDEMHSALRDDMAKILINHGREVHEEMSDTSNLVSKVDEDHLREMAKQISRSRDSYDILNAGINYAIVESFHDDGEEPSNTLSAAGRTIGFLEEARYNAMQGDLRDLSWEKAWSYHTSGAVLNFIPVVGDIAQRGADMVTSYWVQSETERLEGEAVQENQRTYDRRQAQLKSLADQWYTANPEWAAEEAQYSTPKGRYYRIEEAANAGNSAFDGSSGEKES